MSISVTRTTTESSIRVALSEGPVASDYRSKIKTPLPFLNHMIEHIVFRSGFNIELSVELADFALDHLVAEDAGQALGKAIGAYYEKNNLSGMTGFGDATAIIDEARAFCAVSFESRSLFTFDSEIEFSDTVEGMQAEDLKVFLDGVAQGANITIQLSLLRGDNGHHIWEAAFRAVGMALGRSMAISPQRKNMTSGVAGKINYEIK